jgi:hypothetical protein
MLMSGLTACSNKPAQANITPVMHEAKRLAGQSPPERGGLQPAAPVTALPITGVRKLTATTARAGMATAGGAMGPQLPSPPQPPTSYPEQPASKLAAKGLLTPRSSK